MSESGLKSISDRFVGKGVFPYQLAFTLLIPFRNLFLSPKTLIQRLNLKNNFKVLEIGPGPGYFSLEIARIINQGLLYLFDIQQEMLDIARRRLDKHKISNVRFHHASGSTFPFENNLFDRIFMVTVLGEVENREIYAQEIARTLKYDGIVSVSEMRGDPDRMKEEEVVALFNNVGLICCQKFETFFGTTLNFNKKNIQESTAK